MVVTKSKKKDDAKGKKQRKSSHKGQQRKPRNLPKGETSTSPLTLHEFRTFHFGQAGEEDDISANTTSLQWDESAAEVTGSLETTAQIGESLSIRQGDEILVQNSTNGGPFRDLWRMRALEPQESPVDGSGSVELENELALLSRYVGAWTYTKKKSPGRKGWRADQIVADVCKQVGIKTASLAKGSYLQTYTSRKAAAETVVVKAYGTERQHTGKRFFVDTRGGRLSVRVPKRSGSVPIYGDLVRSATVTRRQRKNFATSLQVTAKVGKQTVHATVESSKLVARFGTIQDTLKLPKQSSRAALRRAARLELAKRADPILGVTFTHAGVLGLRRGDQILIRLPQTTIGREVFVKELRHTVSASDHEMEVVTQFTDPVETAETDRKKYRNSRQGKADARAARRRTKKAKQRKAKRVRS